MCCAPLFDALADLLLQAKAGTRAQGAWDPHWKISRQILQHKCNFNILLAEKFKGKSGPPLRSPSLDQTFLECGDGTRVHVTLSRPKDTHQNPSRIQILSDLQCFAFEVFPFQAMFFGLHCSVEQKARTHTHVCLIYVGCKTWPCGCTCISLSID